MPNGGSDCCGTCWFNSKNEGQPGYSGMDKPGEAYCIIRNIEVPDPFWTYCANHPHHNPSRIDVPLGPVYTGEDREVWVLAPKGEEVTQKLLESLNKITNEVQFHYPVSPIDLEITIIDQLSEMKERRAIPGLLKVIDLDIEIYRNYNPHDLDHAMNRNKAAVVGSAILALLHISEGQCLGRVEKFISIGLEGYDPDHYDPDLDNFALIRYLLVSGLQYCPSEKARPLLMKAKKDPHESVRERAESLMKK